MNNYIISIIFYSITIIYFLISKKQLHIYTLKYYDLCNYINDNKNTLRILVNHMIIYITIIRYIRIHFIVCSLLITISFFMEIFLVLFVVRFSMIFVAIIAFIDISSLKTRLIRLEDKLYRTYYSLN